MKHDAIRKRIAAIEARLNLRGVSNPAGRRPMKQILREGFVPRAARWRALSRRRRRRGSFLGPARPAGTPGGGQERTAAANLRSEAQAAAFKVGERRGDDENLAPRRYV
jgi:hypothetical protein